MTDIDTVLDDPSITTFPQDRTCPYHPPEGYRGLTESGPVSRVRLYDGRLVWMITGHPEGRELLNDQRLSSDRANADFPSLVPRTMQLRHLSTPLIGIDDPEHARQRRMLIPSFSVKRIDALRPEIERRANELLDTMLATEPPADLVTNYAIHLPAGVICALLGVPYEDQSYFSERSTALLAGPGAEDVMRAREELLQYFLELIARKEADPGTDVLDDAIASSRADGTYDRQELASIAIVLLIAGHETTSNMISLGTLTLLEHPKQLAALRAEPDLIGGAVDELLRFLSIAEGIIRVATDDIEVGGEVIRKGDGVVIAAPIVNRDPRVYPEPNTLDVRRSARHHVSFGYGIHQCLGQNLARAELEIAMRVLLTRVPTLRLAIPVDEVQIKPGDTLQGPYRLPVTW